MFFSSVSNVDPAGLLEMRARGPVRLVDVRTDAEWAAGMIDGAIHLPLHLLPIKGDEFGGEVPTVFYCRSGARSAQACAFLTAKGLSNVYNLEGGIIAWARAGHSLSQPA